MNSFKGQVIAVSKIRRGWDGVTHRGVLIKETGDSQAYWYNCTDLTIKYADYGIFETDCVGNYVLFTRITAAEAIAKPKITSRISERINPQTVIVDSFNW